MAKNNKYIWSFAQLAHKPPLIYMKINKIYILIAARGDADKKGRSFTRITGIIFYDEKCATVFKSLHISLGAFTRTAHRPMNHHHT